MVLFFNLGGNLRPKVLFVITTFIYKLQTNIFKKYFVNIMSFGIIPVFVPQISVLNFVHISFHLTEYIVLSQVDTLII